MGLIQLRTYKEFRKYLRGNIEKYRTLGNMESDKPPLGPIYICENHTGGSNTALTIISYIQTPVIHSEDVGLYRRRNITTSGPILAKILLKVEIWNYRNCANIREVR